MDQGDVIARLQEELNIPLFNGKLEDKEYSEEDYQKVKNELVQYFEDYVRNVEH